ncbi:hypothetical protein BLOT_014327 [Blomia tropicalis]|nr:hypothetical protein BLOT_014327 [Blomia tropicalis]
MLFYTPTMPMKTMRLV